MQWIDLGNGYIPLCRAPVGAQTNEDVLSCREEALARYSQENGRLAVLQTEIKKSDLSTACYYL